MIQSDLLFHLLYQNDRMMLLFIHLLFERESQLKGRYSDPTPIEQYCMWVQRMTMLEEDGMGNRMSCRHYHKSVNLTLPQQVPTLKAPNLNLLVSNSKKKLHACTKFFTLFLSDVLITSLVSSWFTADSSLDQHSLMILLSGNSVFRRQLTLILLMSSLKLGPLKNLSCNTGFDIQCC